MNITTGSTNQVMKLWKCQPASIKTFGTSQWWCGDPWVTLPCTGDDTHFFNYTSASFGTAVAASTMSSAVDTLAKPNTLSSASSTHISTDAAAPLSTATGTASTNHASTSAAMSDQGKPQSSKLPIALGAGIGSSLGIVIIGCYHVLLYTRRTKLKERRNYTSSSHEREKVHFDGSTPELHDTHRPHELDSNGRNEMPGTSATCVGDFASVIAR